MIRYVHMSWLPWARAEETIPLSFLQYLHTPSGAAPGAQERAPGCPERGLSHPCPLSFPRARRGRRRVCWGRTGVFRPPSGLLLGQAGAPRRLLRHAARARRAARPPSPPTVWSAQPALWPQFFCQRARGGLGRATGARRCQSARNFAVSTWAGRRRCLQERARGVGARRPCRRAAPWPVCGSLPAPGACAAAVHTCDRAHNSAAPPPAPRSGAFLSGCLLQRVYLEVRCGADQEFRGC